jgi:glutamate synthase (NADPH/NADH) small chain
MLNPLPLKERMKIRRQKMPEQDPLQRARNFSEVNLGLETELARREALRCLSCKSPRCVSACPVGVKVREFVELVAAGDILGAAAKIREDNVLPAVTGRVCPQEKQCEGSCILGNRGESLGIGHLERFVADYERSAGKVGLPQVAASTGKRVAIIGSGPAGLSCAGDLALRGHHATVFEALHEIGGVLVYGIPEFRLPKSIVREEVENLRRLGVEFQTNVVVGRTVTVDELLEEQNYDAVFIATGAGLPLFLNIPGEHLCNVYSANEFLTRVNLMRAHEFPLSDSPICDCRGKSVAVFGGGNTAMDAVRTALRLGAGQARIIYRRSEAERGSTRARKGSNSSCSRRPLNFSATSAAGSPESVCNPCSSASLTLQAGAAPSRWPAANEFSRSTSRSSRSGTVEIPWFNPRRPISRRRDMATSSRIRTGSGRASAACSRAATS